MAIRKKPSPRPAAKGRKAAAATKGKSAPVTKAKPAAKVLAAPISKRQPKPQPAIQKVVATKSMNGEVRPAPQDSGLTRKDIEIFEQALLAKRAQLLGDVTTLHNDALGKNRRDAAGDLSSMPIHMADLGTDNYEQEFTLGLIEGERAVLREIDEALDRIRNRSYGLCLATGKPIGKARLKATPWAKFSYEYTLAQERGRARRI